MLSAPHILVTWDENSIHFPQAYHMLEVADAETLEEALLRLDLKDGPVFAVMDGAQFDDLPKALFEGGFVYRPLYKDTSIGDEGRAKTAPHMVWLDERSQKDGRAPEEIIPALLKLIDGKPAAVFWQCPGRAKVI